MAVEALAAGLVGLAGLYLVLQPLLVLGRRAPSAVEPLDPEETPRGIALAALKEIDFDRETGKLSQSDYELLKAQYTRLALEALRTELPKATLDRIDATSAAKVSTMRSAESLHPRCPTCGFRPEPEAIFCSTCGLRLAAASAIPA